jgi:hypothetical protein
MIVIGIGIGMIIAGIMALVRGRFQLSNNKAVYGAPAYLLGVALLAPLPLGFLVATIYMLLNVDMNNQAEAEKWAKEHDPTLTAIVAGVEIGLGLIIVIIAACLAQPLRRAARSSSARNDYDDHEDERPGRRRPRDAYDYEDDRPRRRRDDLDDRAR